MKKIKLMSGITLIALIVTILVLLILAGVTVNLIFSDSGIIKKAWEAKKLTEIEQGREEINLAILGLQTEKAAKGEVCTLEYVYDNIEERVNGLIIDGFKGNPMEKIYVTLRGYQYEIIMDGLVNYIGDGDVSYNEVPDLLIVRDETKTGVDKVTLTITAEVEIGRIEKIITPTGEEKSSSIIYEVTENGEYEFKAVTDKEIETTKKVKISNIRDKNAIDITNLITGAEAEHNHIYESKYDNTSHWQQCTICDKKINVENHTIEIIGNPATCDVYVALGQEVCSKNCGYAKQIERLEHIRPATEDIIWKDSASVEHLCFQCERCGGSGSNSFGGPHTFLIDGKELTVQQLIAEGVNVHSLGKKTCTICKLEVDLSKHSYYASRCYLCTKVQSPVINANISQNQMKNGKIVVDLINHEYQDIYFEVDSKGYEYLSMQVRPFINLQYNFEPAELISKNDNIYLYKTKISLSDINSEIIQEGILRVTWNTTVKPGDIIEGYEMSTGISAENWSIYIIPDTTPPTIDTLTATSVQESNGWATSKQINITGTADMNKTVYVSMYDKSGRPIFEKSAAVVNDGQYSFSTTPNLEADEPQEFTVKVEDMFGNEVGKTITLEKIDAKAPTVVNTPTYDSNWGQYKEVNLEIEENGSKNLQISLNDESSYEVLEKPAEGNYQKAYRFTGDVYKEKKISIYIKDGLNNITTMQITMGKLDNTSPIIENVKVENGVLKIQANDVNNELQQEGSGVSEYAISTTKEMPSDTLFQTKSEFNVETGRTYYIWVKDKAGNYSSMYEFMN